MTSYSDVLAEWSAEWEPKLIDRFKSDVSARDPAYSEMWALLEATPEADADLDSRLIAAGLLTEPPPESLVASNPWHDAIGRFAPKGTGSTGGGDDARWAGAVQQRTSYGDNPDQSRAESQAMVANIVDSPYNVAAPWDSAPGVEKMRDRYVVADKPTLQMNAAMRGEAPQTAGTKKRMAEAYELTSGTAQRDMIVHRGIAVSPATAASLQPGATLTNRGFQSTDSRPDTGVFYAKTRAADRGLGEQVVLMDVRVPAGSHVGPVGSGEFVLRPGVFHVVGRDDTGDVPRLVVEHAES